MTSSAPPVGRPLAVVTGGRRGIGLATARTLALAGFDVAVVDQHLPDVDSERTCAELNDAGVIARYYQLDISDLSAHSAFAERVMDDFGRVDCLVNNAGIAARPLKDVLDLDVEAFDRSVEVNLRGTFFLTQQIARHMVQVPPAGPRSIVMITSVAAELANTERAQYCITKAALSMVVKLLALRLASEGIAVHEIRPGLIQTAMTASATTAAAEEWISNGRVPMSRWGAPAEVAETVAALVTGRLPYMTGQAVWVAGGLNIAQAP